MVIIPSISTERLFLRPFKLEDVPSLVKQAGERAIAETYSEIPHPFNEAMAEGWRRCKLFLLAYLNDVLDLQLDKKTLMSQFMIMKDMFENPNIYRIYEQVQNKNVLILQAMDGTGFDQGEQKALRQTYPGATVHIFKEGGHLTRTTQRSEYDAVLYQFLER